MRSHFQSNLALLQSLDPSLADRMSRLPWPQPGMTVIEARNGQPSLRAVSHDGSETLLHSEYDPGREARQLCDARVTEPNEAYILNGLGLGYLALELAARLEPHRWIVAVESREDLFRAALEVMDLSPFLKRKCVKILLGSDGVGFLTSFRQFLTSSGILRYHLLPYPPCLRLSPKFYDEAARQISLVTNRQQVEFNTLLQLGENIERNCIANLPSLARAYGVDRFRGAFSGVPMIAVAAGPSLNDAIPQLRRVQGKVPIICVGKALRRLLAEGIQPDFVATLDMNPTTMPMFQNLPDLSRILLVFDPDCYSGIPESYPGPIVTYEPGHAFNRWATSFMETKGTLEKGLSVAHTAFYFAAATGASPILLVGADLACPGPETHADGVTMTWGGKVDQTKKNWISIPGVKGVPVRSLSNFLSFVTAFEMGISRTGARTIQTSEIGALIRGAECMSIEKALDAHPLPDGSVSDRLRGILGSPPRFDGLKFRNAAEELLGRLEGFQRRAEEGSAITRQILGLQPENRLELPKFKSKIARAREIQAELLGDKETIELFGRLIAGTVRDMKALEQVRDTMADSDPQQLRKAGEQFQVLFQGLQDACAFYKEHFVPVRDRMLRDFPAN